MTQGNNRTVENEVSELIVLGCKGFLLAPLLLMVITLWFPPPLPSSGALGSLSALYGDLPYSGLFLTLYPHTGFLVFIFLVFRSMALAFEDVTPVHRGHYNVLAMGFAVTSILLPLLGFSAFGFTALFHVYIIGPFALYTVLTSLGAFYGIYRLERLTGCQLMLARGSFSSTRARSRFFLKPNESDKPKVKG